MQTHTGRRRPETAIPEGFPDDAAIGAAAAFYRSEGWDINAGEQAERFRLHAQQNDRRMRDWNAGFEMWIRKATSFPTARKVQHLVSAQPKADDWDGRVREFSRNGYWNDQEWGPRPGRPGCVAPGLVLASHGFHLTLVRTEPGAA